MKARRTKAPLTPTSAASGRLTDAEILATVAITERPDALKLKQLPPEALSQVLAGSLLGGKAVLMFWPDGKQAHTMIPVDEYFPAVDVIIRAYRLCESIKRTSVSTAVSGDQSLMSATCSMSPHSHVDQINMKMVYRNCGGAGDIVKTGGAK